MNAGSPLHAQAGIPSTEDFDSIVARANQARSANQLDQALTLYRQALQLRADWAEGWWNVGTLLYDRDFYAEAADALRHAVKLNPKVGIAFVMLGLSEAQLGQDQRALEHIEQGRVLGVGQNAELRPVVLFTKGTLLLRTADFGKALETLRMLARDGEQQEELVIALGQAALGITPRTFETSDASGRSMVRRAGWAEHLAARREVRTAQQEYETLLADFPKVRNLQFAYGRFLVSTHQDEKAIEAFQRELENTSNHLLARLGIAALKEKSDPSSGLPFAEQAVRLAPNLPEAHYLLGLLLFDTGATARAIQELEIAQHGDPNEAKVYFALGRAYSKMNRTADAVRVRATFNRLQSEAGSKP